MVESTTYSLPIIWNIYWGFLWIQLLRIQCQNLVPYSSYSAEYGSVETLWFCVLAGEGVVKSDFPSHIRQIGSKGNPPVTGVAGVKHQVSFANQTNTAAF